MRFIIAINGDAPFTRTIIDTSARHANVAGVVECFRTSPANWGYTLPGGNGVWGFENEFRATRAAIRAYTSNEATDGDDMSEFDGEEPPREDHFRDDVEADADALASAGMGTDEDYGHFGGDDDGF